MNQWTCRFALAGLSLVGLPALAQDVTSSDTGVATPEEQPAAANGTAPARLPMTASAGFAEQFNTKIDNAGGSDVSFSIARFNAGFKLPVRLSDDYVLASSFRYGFDAYNFNGLMSPPWRNINTLQGSSVLNWRLDDTWSIYGGGFVKTSANSDVALGKGFTGGMLAGFNYKFSDTLSLGLGLAIASQLEDSAQMLPLITANWKFADNWTLKAGLTDVATAGYGIETLWHFNDAWDFGFGVQYHRSRFRIASPDGSVGDGVGEEKAAMLYADATWHATPSVDVDGIAGFTAGGNLSAYNNRRDEVIGNNYKPAFVLGVKGSLRF